MRFFKTKEVLRGLVVIFGLATLVACSTPQTPLGAGQAHDPYEARNRKTHEFNKSLDRALMGSSGAKAETRAPSDLAVELNQSVGNFADNMALPGVVVNKFLQGDLKGFTMNTYRFAINTVLGFGGLFDVASDFGVTADETDFGETLHVWGAPEGAYVELPVLGPSTERDTAGKVVDLFTNPLSYILPKPEKYVLIAAPHTSNWDLVFMLAFTKD